MIRKFTRTDRAQMYARLRRIPHQKHKNQSWMQCMRAWRIAERAKK